MSILVTGSAGHLGEALLRTFRNSGQAAHGLDVRPSEFTDFCGSIVDRELVRSSLRGVHAVIHTATLHKPHVATHSRQAFIDTNITGTLNLLEEAVAAKVRCFVFTSTTSTFGDALTPPADAPAAWITEDVVPVPKNIYGVTKLAAEQLCELFRRNCRLPSIVLRTSRFFPEADDNHLIRKNYADANSKVNEFLYRRVDVEDVVQAHLCALERAQDIGFGRYIISATSPFRREELLELHRDAAAVVARHYPEYAELYAHRGWRMFPTIERVYVNQRARDELGWVPRHDFASMLARLQRDEDHMSPLARVIGAKGYHAQRFVGEPYPVE